jgi:hypothetical protein
MGVRGEACSRCVPRLPDFAYRKNLTQDLDRFIRGNLAWSTQIRAQEGVAKGNHRRLAERLQHLTTFQVCMARLDVAKRADGSGEQFPGKPVSVGLLLLYLAVDRSLDSIIKHYESSTTEGDEMNAQLQAEIRAKVSRYLTYLGPPAELAASSHT